MPASAPASSVGAGSAPTPPADIDEHVIGRALEVWAGELASTGGPDLLRVEDSSPLVLDLVNAERPGLVDLLAGRATRLSTLYPDPTTMAPARDRLREVRVAAQRFYDEHAIPGAHLAVGVLDWPDAPGGPVHAPVLLRPLELVPRGVGGADYELAPGEVARLNPALVRVLGVHPAISAAPDLTSPVVLTGAGAAHVAQRVLDRLRDLVCDLDGASIEERILVGVFAEVGTGLVADLESRSGAIARHPTVAALLAADPLDEATDLRSASTDLRDADRLPREARLDPAQRRVVDTVRAGSDLVVEAPPGSGVVETVAAIVERAHADGRRALVVGPSREALDRLGERLKDQPTAPDRESVITAHHDLHRPQHPWQLSRMQVLTRLVELGADPSSPGAGALSTRTLRDLHDPQRRGEAARLLVDADAADAFAEAARSGPWAGSALSSHDDAQAAVAAVDRLRQAIPATRTVADHTVAEAGLAPMSTVAQWRWIADLLGGVRDTLERFTPEVFERDLNPMLAATAPRGRTRTMRPLERRRWRREAESLVRPGVRHPDLHIGLAAAHDQTAKWRSITGGGAAPEASPLVGELASSLDGIAADLGYLDAVLGVPRSQSGRSALTDTDTDALLADLDTLAAAGDDLRALPRRQAVLADLEALGLGTFVGQLREQGIAPEAVDNALEIAWYRGVLAEMDGSSQNWDLTETAGRPTQVSATGEAPADLVTALSVPSVVGDAHYDLVVLLEAHRVGLAEAVLAISRADQSVILGAPGGLPPAGLDPAGMRSRNERAERTSLFEASITHLPSLALTRAHRHPRELADLVATLGDVTGPAQAAPAAGPVLRRHHVPGGTTSVTVDAVPVAPPAEVSRVVDLVQEHAEQRAGETLVVLTPTRRAARAVADGVRAAVPASPQLREWLAAGQAEPFVVTDIAHADPVVRDRVVLSLGIGLTPHGRLVHRFGPIDGEHGERLLVQALARARVGVDVVTSLSSTDLDEEKLATPGGRMLRRLLVLLEAEPVDAQPAEALGQNGVEPEEPVLASLYRWLCEHAGARVGVPTEPRWGDPALTVASDTGPVAVLWDGRAPVEADGIDARSLVTELHDVARVLTRTGWRVVTLSAETIARDVAAAGRQVLGTEGPDAAGGPTGEGPQEHVPQDDEQAVAAHSERDLQPHPQETTS